MRARLRVERLELRWAATMDARRPDLVFFGQGMCPESCVLGSSAPLLQWRCFRVNQHGNQAFTLPRFQEKNLQGIGLVWLLFGFRLI